MYCEQDVLSLLPPCNHVSAPCIWPFITSYTTILKSTHVLSNNTNDVSALSITGTARAYWQADGCIAGWPLGADGAPDAPQIGPLAKVPVAAARNIGACLLQDVHHVHRRLITCG